MFSQYNTPSTPLPLKIGQKFWTSPLIFNYFLLLLLINLYSPLFLCKMIYIGTGKVEETVPFPSADLLVQAFMYCSLPSTSTRKLVPFPLHLRAKLFPSPYIYEQSCSLSLQNYEQTCSSFPADLRARSTRFQNFQLWRLISFNWSPQCKRV